MATRSTRAWYRKVHPLFDALEPRELLSIGIPGDGVLDITFIGDQYLDLNQWHADVQRFTAGLLSYEPFKSRADQIQFHDIDNTTSLEARRDPAMPRLLSVNNSLVTSLVEASGVRTDIIGVLVNDPELGGAGGGIPVSYNGLDLGPQVFAHEFGHSFGRLFDEYLYGSTGPIDNQSHSLDWNKPGNVYAGSPPAAAWKDAVAPDEYFLGGGMDNWYRSSLRSLMSDLGSSFNAVSMNMISEKIDYWAGPSPDHEAPQVSIAGLTNGSTVSGVVHVTASMTDNRGVTDAQLWVDGQLARTTWQAPFTLDWTTGHSALGTHTLLVRAMDASGNVGVSAPIDVYLTSGADIQIVSPANNTQITGTLIPMTLSLWRNGVDHFSVQIDGKQVCDLNLGFDSSETAVFLNAPLAEGPHTLTIIASVSNPDSAHLLERYRTSITLVSANKTFGIAFSSPRQNATVSGLVNLAVNATLGKPTRVQYYADGVLIGTSTKAPFGWKWDTRKLKNGTHKLSALARNAAGLTATAESLVLVKNPLERKPPVVSVAEPRNSQKLKRALIRISGKATDNVAVSFVELLIDNQVKSMTKTPKFSFIWDATTMTKGKHRIRVRAYDTSGNVGLSPVKTIQLV